jgi:hypothetical protein
MRSRIFFRMLFALVVLSTLIPNGAAAPRSRWRTASGPELKNVIPARAPVMKENIETEMRSASGVTNGRGKFIAGALMITAGYSADGKYSHFFVTQVPIKIGSMELSASDYVIGYQRVNNDTIRVTFYRASSGEVVGDVEAHPNKKTSMVRSLWITAPAAGKGGIQIGRYIFEYSISA